MSDLSTIVWPKGLKKTKQRLEILEALFESGKPMSARELYLILEKRGSPQWLSTIYRSLDTLLAHGAIQKAAVHENGMSVYEIGNSHRHYAVCGSCQSIMPINGCPLESVIPQFVDKDFHVMGHSLQISGYCGDCYDKLSGKPPETEKQL